MNVWPKETPLLTMDFVYWCFRWKGEHFSYTKKPDLEI